MRYSTKIFAFFSALLFTYSSFAQKTFIHCGKFVDVVNLKMKEKITIIIEGNKIVQVMDGLQAPTDSAKLIDLSNYTVMPGLMDMHVHIEAPSGRGNPADRFQNNPEDIAIYAVKNADVMLLRGFTSVRDVGGSQVSIALRNAITRGTVKGPRIFAASTPISTTGGHSDPTINIRRDLDNDPGPREGIINGIEDARKAVRYRYKEGADLIKIMATGGVMDQGKDGSGPHFSFEELKAICETAKDFGLRVAAHAHGAEGIKRSILAGVSSIEHGTFMDDECIELFKKHNVWYVPTISAGKGLADSAKKDPSRFSPVVLTKILETAPKAQAAFLKAYKAGVKIAYGTDAGGADKENRLEFQYMYEAGMPALETIKAATLTAADLLGIKDKLGSIEPGKWADIVAVEGDPVADIKVMLNMVFVMKDGIVYKSK
jgi:imidazolonepropionase-like amidohydrolase